MMKMKEDGLRRVTGGKRSEGAVFSFLKRFNGCRPPSFFRAAEYAGNEATIDIQNAHILRGYLPGRQLKLVLAWCVMYQDELMQNWELAKSGRTPERIPPMRRG